MAIIQLAIK